MNAKTLICRLMTLGLATLLAGAPANAQLAATHAKPAGLNPPQSFGASLLVDPVDVAVMSWCHTPITWAYVADAGANKIVRFLVKSDGTTAVPIEWSKWLDGPWGVAVNDLPGHPQQEVVYATGTNLSGQRVVQTFDKWGNGYPGNYFQGDPTDKFVDPRGIAVGPNGNVYVVDMGRRVIEEFEAGDVYTYNQATPLNKYGLFSMMVPFDVSVDLMHRVHVAGNQYFPFPDGYTEIYQNGDLSPTADLPYTNRIQGIDAKGLFDTRYTWADSAVADLHTLKWTDTVWPSYTFSSSALKTVPTSGSAPVNLGGLELQRSWRIIGLDGSDRIVRCDGRTFVADRADGEVQIMATKKDSTPRPADAVAWWKFDEGAGTLAKEILNNRHGTWSAAGARATEGVVRCALSFNGGTFAVEVPNHASLEVGLSDFTLEGWIRSEFQTGTKTFLHNRSVTGTGYRAFLDNGQLGFEIDDGTSTHTTTTTASAAVNDGLWHHVAMVVERGVETRLYVDGSLAASGFSGAVSGPLSSGTSLFLGNGDVPGSAGLQGGLDEISLYHRALTAAEINAIDSAECAGKHLPPLSIGTGVLSASVPATL